jgi:mono/diheme cytochrome c family protein
MKRFFKILAYILGGVAVLVIGFLIYFTSAFPKVDAPVNIKVEVTAARLARGEYLAKHVTVCMDCHSTRDWTRLSGPLTPGTLGKGGDKFGEEIGFPGTLYAKNITPSGIGKWTDGELMRLVTCGVNKDGKAVFPLMPYYSYNKLTEEDLYSIVAYVRSLQSIENSVPEGSLDFPLNLIVRTMPLQNYKASPEPNKNNPPEYGKYLTTISGCYDCHTQSVKGEYIHGKEFAGGAEFNFPGGVVRSANITPEPITGIGEWSKEQFIARFKIMNPDSNQTPSVGMKDFNSAMPWTMYAGMTREDLGAIYEHLRTLKPIKNIVMKWTPSN